MFFFGCLLLYLINIFILSPLKNDPFAFFFWRLRRKIGKSYSINSLILIFDLNFRVLKTVSFFLCRLNRNVFFVYSEQSRSRSNASCIFSSVFQMSNYR